MTDAANRPKYLLRFADGTYLGSPATPQGQPPRVASRELAAVVARDLESAEARADEASDLFREFAEIEQY